MEQGFIDKLKEVISEYGQDVLLDKDSCKKYLSDYTEREYPKETRRITQAAAAGVTKAIASEQANLEACKKKSIKTLEEDHFIAYDIAADIVNTLALVLKNDTTKTEFVDDLVAQANSYMERRENVKAFELYKKAAEAGNAEAMYMLSKLYGGYTRDIPFNRELRDEWCIKAAEQGNKNALFYIGCAYKHGTNEYGVKGANQEKAFEYFMKAADAGSESSMETIGECYEYGIGTVVDLEKAIYWYKKSGCRKKVKELQRELNR